MKFSSPLNTIQFSFYYSGIGHIDKEIVKILKGHVVVWVAGHYG